MTLFDPTPETPPQSRTIPLAERMRPRTLADYAGQQHLLAPGKPLRLAIENDDPASMIFWGPPGVGKTSLAKIIALRTQSTFIEFSAVLSGIKEIKQVMVDAEKASHMGSRTILFVDEIHRFNKAQQDAFLPYVERGAIRLIGATTENPSFEINAALLSRCRVYTLQPLTEEDLIALLNRALATLAADPTPTPRVPHVSAASSQRHGNGNPATPHLTPDPSVPHSSTASPSMSGNPNPQTTTPKTTPEITPETPATTSSVPHSSQSHRDEWDVTPHPATLQATPEALQLIAQHASGDARTALNALEVAAQLTLGRNEQTITQHLAAEALQRRTLLYDKSGEQHYDLISALHKSIRNSDPDAALYWLGRMLASGEDPIFLARRLVRMAVEDIGLAAPEALNLTLSARDAMHFLGSPEGELALAQAAVYLALAPKSNAVYTAFGAVQQDIARTAAQPVPLHLRNAPTQLMKSLDYGKDYQYAHDLEQKVANMQCLPDNLRDRRYYHPTNEGRERQLAQRLEDLNRLRNQS